MDNDAPKTDGTGDRPQRVAVVVNPHSGNGRTRWRWRQIEQALRDRVGDYTLFQTSGPGDATAMARSALETGYDCVLSAGGDGTHFEVVNGFFTQAGPVNPNAVLGILPFGTGADLARTMAIPRGPKSVPMLTEGPILPVDVGRAEVTADSGQTAVWHFLSTVHMGVGSITSDIVNRRSKFFGGFLSFLLGVISARFVYSMTRFTVVTGDETFEESCLDVIAANGRFDGGGMRVAPNGRLDDGLLEVYIVGELGITGTLLNIPRLYRGTHGTHPNVTYLQAPRVEVSASAPILVGLDGEVAGRTPATLSVLPQALRVIAGPEMAETDRPASGAARSARETAV